MTELTVSKITIENIKGCAFCELDLHGKNLVVLRGANGAGKTSILDAIRAVFAGGSDFGLVRKGEKTGKVVIELSDGTLIKKSQSARGAQLSITTADGQIVKAPQTYIEENLNASFAFDPLAFVSAPHKERLAYLQQAMPLEFGGAEIHALKFGQLDAAGPVRPLVAPDAKLTLEHYDSLRQQVYEQRRQANAAVAELDKTVQNLRKSLPAGGDGKDPDADAELKVHSERLQALEQTERADLDLIAREVAQAKEQAVNAYLKARDEAQRVYEEALAAARKTQDATLADIAAGEKEALERIQAENAPKRAGLQQKIGAAQNALKHAGEVQALRNHLEEQRKRLAEKSSEAESLDHTLTALDELRKSKTTNLPIQGLEIRDGEIYDNGIPFGHLNRAKQFIRAVEIGTLTVGNLPLVLADDTEHLDEKERDMFYQAVKESGLQMVVAEVSAGPLRSDPQGALKL